jgi:hypothetical protein
MTSALLLAGWASFLIEMGDGWVVAGAPVDIYRGEELQ